MSSRGSERSSSPPSPEWSETERIAASPRPIPRALSATSGHLLGKVEVRARARAVRIVMDHRPPEAGRLADTDVTGDDRLEDELGKVLANLALDVPGQPGAGVVHGQQHARQGQSRVELALHDRDRVE